MGEPQWRASCWNAALPFDVSVRLRREHVNGDRVEEGHLLTCSVNEDPGGTAVLLFDVLQVVLRLVHSAVGRKHRSDSE